MMATVAAITGDWFPFDRNNHFIFCSDRSDRSGHIWKPVLTKKLATLKDSMKTTILSTVLALYEGRQGFAAHESYSNLHNMVKKFV